ncbi:hypothetical protein R3P38DRAFT_2866491 [Favolaschia claudopus]|uniref:MYND-type domain-containing protein n=1 Tax=Favolaschia claudopus TaxID=2862362 RepID=A0AAW0DKQ9_9AGAR
MHPALHLNNLQRLSISLRRFITPILHVEPTLQEVSRFHKLVLKQIPKATLAEFIPAFYYVLNPARIPKPEELDPPTTTQTTYIILAVTALTGLFGTAPAAETVPALWPRVWAWIDFLSTFANLLSETVLTPLTPDFIYEGMCFCNRLLSKSPDKEMMIASSPGFCVLALRLWINETDASRQIVLLVMVENILVPALGDCYRDVLEATDGDLNKFAKVMSRHLNTIVPLGRAEPHIDVLNSETLRRTLNILFAVDTCSPERRALSLALIPLGLVKTLTFTARALGNILSSSSFYLHRMCLQLCLIHLRSTFIKIPGKFILPMAIRHGILDAILSAARIDFSDNPETALEDLLNDILAPSTVLCYTLPDIGKAFARVTEHREFVVPEVQQAWDSFVMVLSRRLRVLARFNSEDRLTQRACDNVECGSFFPKPELKHCSSCMELFYCSRKCQAIDWKRGHRTSCDWYAKLRANRVAAFTSREYSFLCYLQNIDYEYQKVKLRKEHDTLQAENSDVVLWTRYDYSCLPPTVTVTWGDPSPDGCDQGEQWKDIIDRVERGGGERWGLEVIRVWVGNTLKDFMLPLRRISDEKAVETELDEAQRQVNHV